MQRLPLTGVRVIDFTQLLAGPHCTLWLASLGADVIKIESRRRPDPFRMSQPRPGETDPLNQNPLFITSNLMKRDCGIDIASPAGQELCHELIKRSDVVVENFRPGVVENFGLGYEQLREVKPDIIMASVSGYGHTGAYAAFSGMAPNLHAFSGLSAATGFEGGPPEQIFMYYGDIPPGQAAALGIIGALRHRKRTGEGQYIDVAMSEVLASLAPEPVLEYTFTGRTLLPRGNRDLVMVPHGCYPCAGRERWLAVAVASEERWQQFAAILGHEEWTRDPRFSDVYSRHQNEDALDELIAEATRPQEAPELVKRLLEAGIAAAPSNNIKDLLGDSQLLDTGFVLEIDQPVAGPALLPLLPWNISTVPERPVGPAPVLVSATDQVMRDVLELPDERIQDLRAAGVID
jgi:crotonobetainyl-CoA:carnitine CoA-transferase CaiB-like acyl-CoA transferase